MFDTHKAEIESIVAQYADRRSAVLPLLYIAQDSYGHLTNEAIREVAEILDMPETDVFEVVGFYTLFYNRPVGKWVLQVCDDVPCCYCGAEELIDALKQKLQINEDETTADGMFTLQRVKCLAACDRPPVLQANLDYVYDVTLERIDTLLRELRARADRGEQLSVSGRMSEDYEWRGTQLVRIPRDLGPIQAPAPPASAPEPANAAAEEQTSAPEQPAQQEAEQKIDEESPVEPAPDRSPAGAMPAPEQQSGEALPPNQTQHEAPQERTD